MTHVTVRPDLQICGVRRSEAERVWLWPRTLTPGRARPVGKGAHAVEVTLTAVLAAILLFGLLFLGAKMLTSGAGDVVMLFLLGFGLFYGFRPLLFVLGLDEPFPEEIFSTAESSEVLTKTLLGLSLYLGFALLGIAAVTQSGMRGFGPFFVSREIDLRRAIRVVALLTGLGTVLSVYLVVRFGGIGGSITAAKVDKALAGLYLLRTIPAVGAVVATATFIDARKRAEVSRVLAYTALACAVANAFYVFLWGSRSVLVVVGATLILGWSRRQRQPQRSTAKRQQVALRLGLAALLVMGVASGLRIARDTLTRGEVQDVYAEGTTARQASLATNSIVFDAAMLSFRDWPQSFEYRDGEDYSNGVIGLVPRALWEDKPTDIVPGKWFRQVYEPNKINGWPMGAGALWYLNFGWPGLMLGGIFSGFVLGAVAAAQRRMPRNGFNTAVGVVIGVYVLGLGWDNETLIRAVIWLGPLYLVARYVAPKARRRADVSEPPAYAVTLRD